MLTRNFPCERVFQLINNMPVRRRDSSITIGRDYQNCYSAYFYLPLIDFSSTSYINCAQFVMFGVKNTFSDEDCIRFHISPTTQYLNPYVGFVWGNEKESLKSYEINVPFCGSVFVLDVTDLVANWSNLTVPNRGMIVEMKNPRGSITFAGAEDRIAPPFLQISYHITGEVPPVYHQPCVELAATARIKEVSNE